MMKDSALDAPAPARCACAPRAGAQEFELLFEASLDAVLWVGPDGTILRANAAACELLARPVAQLSSMKARDLIAPRDIRARPLIEQCRLEGHASGVLTALRADGTPVEVSVRMAHQARAGESHAFVTFRRSIEAVHPAAAPDHDLRHLLPSLAHDLRAPLGTLAGFAKALERALGGDAPPRSRHYVQRILAAVGQLESHVEAVLSFARASHGPLTERRVDLSAAAHQILCDLQLRDLDRIVSVRVEEGICAQGDPRLIRIVLENLLGNAWKFTRRRAEARISFTAAPAADGSVVYQVRDNGAGFDMAYAGKLFRDFQRLHSQAEFPGTGIGLANVQRIVERHGGRVWAESTPGEGATFFFTLGACAAVPPARGCEGCTDRLERRFRDGAPA